VGAEFSQRGDRRHSVIGQPRLRPASYRTARKVFGLDLTDPVLVPAQRSKARKQAVTLSDPACKPIQD